MSKKKKFIGEVEESKAENSALKVNDGIASPPQINPNLRKFRRRLLSFDEYFEGIVSGNRTILGQAITLVESKLEAHQEMAQKLIEKCLPLSSNSLRIGITGVPGAGKSTFIEALGLHVVNSNNKLAVLAVDPSSGRTKGSILGDKTRMEQLSIHDNAFIRPSPSEGTLGGVARKTRETIILCEAAGYNIIFIETVGVGQSEIAVHSMVDFFLLLMLAGAGDELQGIKRGIMEMADAITVNKADGNNISKANMAKAQYQSALHLFPQAKSKWTPKVLTCSALYNTGIEEIWDMILDYEKLVRENKYFNENRNEQALYWMHQSINEAVLQKFYNNPDVKNQIHELENMVRRNKISSFVAASKLLDFDKNK
ncbi:MAG: methylmalonyl Co-A mutase-associated GTPase MeaB [Bacteroidales bacterium]|nr:methylmalonyl Co-A mutase-associated GTPase MeaB [Bacteroidales bacterium]